MKNHARLRKRERAKCANGEQRDQPFSNASKGNENRRGQDRQNGGGRFDLAVSQSGGPLCRPPRRRASRRSHSRKRAAGARRSPPDPLRELPSAKRSVAATRRFAKRERDR